MHFFGNKYAEDSPMSIFATKHTVWSFAYSPYLNSAIAGDDAGGVYRVYVKNIPTKTIQNFITARK